MNRLTLILLGVVAVWFFFIRKASASPSVTNTGEPNYQGTFGKLPDFSLSLKSNY